MLGQAQSRGQVLQGVREHGVAPGGRKMIDWEEEAAELALQTGIYGVYRNINTKQDCTRIGPSSKCFCGHLYSGHTFLSKKAPYPRCNDCQCSAFCFVPTRPEEVGDWWLVRRKGFNVHTWRAKCRCGHSHEDHDPKHMRCRCGCSHFQSNFACVACDKLWEDHETVFESVQERLALGKTVGEEYRPLADDSSLREAVFSQQARARSTAPSKVRPAAVPAHLAEKSVQIMHESSGGRVRGQEVVNRYGKVENPPEEWLYLGGGGGGNSGSAGHRTQGSEVGAGSSSGRDDGRVQAIGMSVGGVSSRPGNRGSVGQVVGRGVLAGGGASLGPAAVQGSGGTMVGNVMKRGIVKSTAEPGVMASGFRPVYD